MSKGPAVIHRALVLTDTQSCLDFAYVRRLGPFLSFCNIETDPVSLGERFKTITLNFREVNEHIRSIVLLDKPKTLRVVKPLHSTFCHLILHVSLWEFFCCASSVRPK